jgi:hypothetical protein
VAVQFEGAPAWAIPAGLAVVTGLIALVAERPLVILGTAAAGATMLIGGGLEAAGQQPKPWIVIAFVVLVAGAAIVQFRHKPRALDVA